MHHTPTTRRRAFTLLELIVVIVVLGILAAIAIVGYQAVIARSELATIEQRNNSVARETAAILAFADGTTPEDALAEALGDLPAAAAGVLAADVEIGAHTLTDGPTTGPDVWSWAVEDGTLVFGTRFDESRVVACHVAGNGAAHGCDTVAAEGEASGADFDFSDVGGGTFNPGGGDPFEPGDGDDTGDGGATFNPGDVIELVPESQAPTGAKANDDLTKIIYRRSVAGYQRLFLWDTTTEVETEIADRTTSHAISGDGNTIAFTSTSTALGAGSSSGQVFVYDVTSGETTKLTSSSGTGSATQLTMTADGTQILFRHSRPITPGDTNGVEDVYVVDVASGVIERVSVGNGGAQANAASHAVGISDDGRYVLFETAATSLSAGSSTEVFLRDRDTDTTVRVNTSAGSYGGGATISPDGSTVLYKAANSHLMRYDIADGTTTTLIGQAVYFTAGAGGWSGATWVTMSNQTPFSIPANGHKLIGIDSQTGTWQDLHFDSDGDPLGNIGSATYLTPGGTAATFSVLGPLGEANVVLARTL